MGSRALLTSLPCRTDVCAFSEARIYPGRGTKFVRRDGQVWRCVVCVGFGSHVGAGWPPAGVHMAFAWAWRVRAAAVCARALIAGCCAPPQPVFLSSSKCTALYLAKKKPAKFTWTQVRA